MCCSGRFLFTNCLLVIYAKEALQINVYIPSSLLNVFNTQVQSKLFYPLAIVQKESELNEANAKQIQRDIYDFSDIDDDSPWVLIACGGFVLTIGLIFFGVAVVPSRRRLGYIDIDNPPPSTDIQS